MSYLLRLTAALALILFTQAAQAGTWTRLQAGSPDECALLFQGAIEQGDLTAAIDQGLLNGFNLRVCLDSPGGSLAEVLAFIEASEDEQGGFFFGTRVRSGDECLSSCALLFMFGKAFGANSPFPSRQLEPGARLGFHSPFIRDGASRAGSDSEVFRVALQVAKLLADRSYKAPTADGPALPQELLALVLGTPAAAMRYVETIAEARVMNIELTRNLESEAIFPDRRDVIDRLMKQICIGTHTLTYRQHMVDEGYDFADLVRRATDPQMLGPDYQIHARKREPQQGYSPERISAVITGPEYFVPGWFSAGSQQYCRAELQIEPAPGGFRVVTYLADFGQAINTDLTRVPEPTFEIRVTLGGLLPLDTRY